MKRALSGLTFRGMTLIAVGLGLAVGSWTFGQRDLLRIAILLLALPLLSVVLVGRTSYRLACRRVLPAGRIELGDDVEVTLTVGNASSLPSGLLLVEDTVPWTLGESPRLTLDRVEPRGQRSASYVLTGTSRGRYAIGPTRVRLVDPFGLVSMSTAFTTIDSLLVTPRVVALQPMPLHGDLSGRGDSRLRTMATTGDDDVLPRDYRIGDDLRRVHWSATARSGELMVRREERPWQSRATIICDTRSDAHDDESFEWALSAAASIGVHLAARGWGVRLLGPHAQLLCTEDQDTRNALLTALAMAEPDRIPTLGFADIAERRMVSDGLVIAILGSVSEDEAAALAKVRHGSGTAMAILCGSTSGAVPTLLERTGWSVAPRAEDIAATWSRLGRQDRFAGVAR